MVANATGRARAVPAHSEPARDAGSWRGYPHGPDRGAHAIARLTKHHVETLFATYDEDPVEALSAALRVVLGEPDAGWTELIAAAGFGSDRARRLAAGDVAELDALASELNELRTLGPRR